MGLLDWLTDGMGLGDAASMGAAPNPPGVGDGGGQTPPMPPVQQTGTDAPSLADPMTQAMTNPSLATAAPPAPPPPPGAPANPATDGGLPSTGISTQAPPPPVPLPAPRPPGAPGAPDTTTPPNAAPTMGGPGTADAINSYNNAGGKGLMPTDNGGIPGGTSKGILESALGLSPERANRMRGALGAGLKAAGENSTKPGLAALAGSAGSAIEGGKNADDKAFEQKTKALTAAVTAQKAGDDAAAKVNYNKYLMAKLKQDTDKTSGGGQKWNKPDAEKFHNASADIAKDPTIAAAQKTLESALKTGEGVKEAQAALQDTIQKQSAFHYLNAGLNPITAKDIGKQPGMTQENAIPPTGLTKDNFMQKVQPGQWYVNPADGKTYQRKMDSKPSGGGESGGEAKPATAPEPMDPTHPTRTPNTPTRTPTADDDE